MTNLKDISTEDLINELSNRNLFEELSEEKQTWLRTNGFYPINNLQFINMLREGNSGYSLKYLKSHSLEELIQKDEKIQR